MHEKILQGVTIGVVGGLIVYWMTSKRSERMAERNSIVAQTGGTCADCHCDGLPAAETTTNPLASDYLCGAPSHAPAISGWNLGVAINTNCGLNAKVYADRMQSAAPHGIRGPNTYGRPIRVDNPFLCNRPCLPGQTCCNVEVI